MHNTFVYWQTRQLIGIPQSNRYIVYEVVTVTYKASKVCLRSNRYGRSKETG